MKRHFFNSNNMSQSKPNNNPPTKRNRSQTLTLPDRKNDAQNSKMSETPSSSESKPIQFDPYFKDKEAINKGTIHKSLDNTLNKVADYFHNELMLASDDLQLLETFNEETIKQFNKMSIVTQELIADGHKMNQAFSDFEPFLKQIDEISRQIDYLELVTNELDEYSFELEEKVKTIKTRKDKFKKNSSNTFSSAIPKR